ncbi:MAG: DUF2889 domain-containing protein [Smithellaceae bacterium]|nr:DUF2889 domain-containing protein [Smithellaceae bacterium]
MQSVWKSKGEKIHTRNITVTTYNYDGQRIIVEGFLKDDRFQDSHVITGETFPGGVIHHMGIRLLVNCSSLLIEEVDVDLLSVPRNECRETINCLAPVKGLTITRGFTAKVKKLAGGKNGCTHLVELLLAMAPAAVQGFAAHQSQKTPTSDPAQAKMIYHFLLNTCRAWREDGPLAESFKKMIDRKKT